MITAVDTNVLIDVFGADPKFGPASAAVLRRCSREGRLVACDVVWAEAVSVFPSGLVAVDLMGQLGVEFDAVGHAAAVMAGDAWRAYRERGGKRTRLVADFIVGAHAAAQADRLFTRDRGFYRTYFAGVDVLDPQHA